MNPPPHPPSLCVFGGGHLHMGNHAGGLGFSYFSFISLASHKAQQGLICTVRDRGVEIHKTVYGGLFLSRDPNLHIRALL